MRKSKKGTMDDMQPKMYELTQEEIMEPITKEMAESCRHRLEKRWYRRFQKPM